MSDGPTMAALAVLMRLVGSDVTDAESISDALAAVLGADSESAEPVNNKQSEDDSSARSVFDTVVALPPDTPDITAADDGGSIPTVSSTNQRVAGLTPLEFAVLRQNIPFVTQLLKAGASVDFIGGFSCTALCKCCYNFHSNVELIRLLLAAGANPDATTNNDTHSASCLIISVVKNNAPVVQALLEYGADVSYEWKGSNALAMALDFKKLDIAQLFENFEYRKAQQNRWQRFQDRRRRDEADRASARSNSPATDLATPARAGAAAVTPTAEGSRTPPLEQRHAPDDRLVAANNFGAHDSPKSKAASALLSENLSNMDWLVSVDDIQWGPQINGGAHGQIFRVTLKSTGDVCALKKFACLDARQRESFRREVEMLTKFRHENIVMFKGAVISEDLSAMLTQLCTESLFDRLQRGNPLPWPLRIRWARDIARAMTYLHTRTPPVVHRDLKSLNVLLDSSGTIKLCDFGIARLREHTVVMTQHIAGSPSWMAPEVLRGDDFGPASDVYSFGVVLWELLMRQVPWPNKNLAQLVGLVGFAHSTLELPDTPPEDCPAGFIAIIRRCFAAPADRPTFRTLREELDAMLVDVD